MIPISFVPHDPDHSGVFWTEKPHPLPEVLMSKEIGMPLVVGPSSPPSDGGNPNTPPPASSTSASPWSITGSSMLKGNDSTEWTGTTGPMPQGPTQDRGRHRGTGPDRSSRVGTTGLLRHSGLLSDRPPLTSGRSAPP